MKKKRDAFILRYGKESEFPDKVIQEEGLAKEFKDKDEKDKCLQELASISLTPIAKFGLGKHFTFDFIAPCFEKGKAKS